VQELSTHLVLKQGSSAHLFEKRIFLRACSPPPREAGDVGVSGVGSPKPPLQLIVAGFLKFGTTESMRAARTGSCRKKINESSCTYAPRLVVRLAPLGFRGWALRSLLSNLSSPDFRNPALPNLCTLRALGAAGKNNLNLLVHTLPASS
jgi:hypothetical protein